MFLLTNNLQLFFKSMIKKNGCWKLLDHILLYYFHIPKYTMYSRVTRVVTDQAGSEILCRSYQNKPMKSNYFDVNVPVPMCAQVEARANNCENKVWLTSTKNWFLVITTFLEPAIFRSMRSKKWTKKWKEPKSHRFQKLLSSCEKNWNWFTTIIVFRRTFYLNAHCDRYVNL